VKVLVTLKVSVVVDSSGRGVVVTRSFVFPLTRETGLCQVGQPRGVRRGRELLGHHVVVGDAGLVGVEDVRLVLVLRSCAWLEGCVR